MTGGYMLFALARNPDKILNEGLVTAASIALIASSILWVVLSRLVIRNLRRAADIPTAAPSFKVSRDIWREPPGASSR